MSDQSCSLERCVDELRAMAARIHDNREIISEARSLACSQYEFENSLELLSKVVEQ